MTGAVDYDLRLALGALSRRWWIVVLVPAVALAIQLYQIRTAPYRAEFQAIVILPGDTDIPGSSERPELMVMDDVPTLVSSGAFAEHVLAELAPSGGTSTAEDIQEALSATRYARAVTVVARDDNALRVVKIATAAEAVFAEAVNDVLVADGAQSAMVTIIDRVDGAHRGEPAQWRVAAIVTTVMVFVGVVAALLVDGRRRPPAGDAQSSNS